MTQSRNKQKNKKPHPTQFKPGQSGNPAGRKKMPGDLKTAKIINQIEVARVMNNYLYKSKEILEAKLNEKDLPMLERYVIKVMLNGAEKADHQRLGFIFDRTIGSVPQKTEVSFHEAMLAIKIQIQSTETPFLTLLSRSD